MIDSPAEIVRSYRMAADPKKQIKVLAELNACSVKEIRQVLVGEGVLPRETEVPEEPKKAAKKRFDEETARMLYEEGLDDAAIAKATDMTAHTVAKWRSRNGLRKKARKPRMKKQVDVPSTKPSEAEPDVQRRIDMKKYIGTKIIEAEPAYRVVDAEGNVRVVTEAAEAKRCGTVDLGYKVRYPDGYESFSPKGAFDDAYHPINGMNFGLAIEALRKGFRVHRRGWNGKGIFIELQTPDAYSKITSPYIYIDTTGLQTQNTEAPKSRVPWLASQTDMLAEDWEIFA